MIEEVVQRDETVHCSVLDEFDRDPTVPSDHVGAAVTDGLVTVVGTVRTDHDRLATVGAVRRVGGVRVILDAISVGDKDPDFTADHAIANRLARILDATSDVPSAATFTVRNRVITLDGVGTVFDRQTMRRLAGYAPGVNWVRDNLVIRPFERTESDLWPEDSPAVSPTTSQTPSFAVLSVAFAQGS